VTEVSERTLPARKRIEAAAIAAVGMPLIEALGATWRWNVRGAEHVERVKRDGRQPIYALWHGRILPGTLYLRDRDIVVMTSENFDGEWVARLIRRFGFDTARGSTSHGGARAMVQLRREMRRGRPAAFTIDGPRGPARVAQPGAIWLASLTGNPVIPFHVEAAEAWTVRSWDRHQVPKPGSALGVAIGEPIEVVAAAAPDEIESARLALETSLARLEAEATELAREGSH
jgi:lysophospholipid acyltransferase (LPLAT)-like uncharacterized protein